MVTLIAHAIYTYEQYMEFVQHCMYKYLHICRHVGYITYAAGYIPSVSTPPGHRCTSMVSLSVLAQVMFQVGSGP